MYSDFGIEKIKKLKVPSSPSIWHTKNEGYYWTNTSSPKQMPIRYLNMITQKAEELLKAGFGVVIPTFWWYCARYRSFGCFKYEDQGIRLLANQISNHFSFQEV
jgi:hypothetical protein